MTVNVFVGIGSDANPKDLPLGQARSPGSPFEVEDSSVKVASAAWCEAVRRQIARADFVVVLCGQATYTATGVKAQIEASRVDMTPYFLITRYSDGVSTPTAALTTDQLYVSPGTKIKPLTSGCR